MELNIKVGSITNAQRGQKLLRERGYKPIIKRVEKPSKADGCGYIISVHSSGNEPVEILKKNRIEVRSVDVK